MKKLLTLFCLVIAFILNAQTVTISSSASGVVCAGTPVTFTANLTGYTSPTYQWYKNNVAISGETSATYSSSTLINNDAIKVAVFEAGASVSTSNLVMNLDAGNSLSYSSGNTWTDLTGRGNNGTIPIEITHNSGNGGYFQFADSKGIVLPSTSSDFNLGTSDFTIELWVNPNATTHRILSINGRSNPTASSAFSIYCGASGYLYSNAGTVSSGFTWNNWHHVVISRVSTTYSTYVDGVLKVTTTDASSLGSNIIGSNAAETTSNTLGSFFSTSTYLSYRGKMSIARVYKGTGLTSSQVISNYNAICSRYGLSAIGSTSNSIATSITAGPAANVTVSGDACINKTTLSTTSGLSSYAWHKDNVAISGATANTFVPSSAGDYRVIVFNGTCSTTSSATTISTCGVTADGRMQPVNSPLTLISNEGGFNFGTGVSELGTTVNVTGISTTLGTIGATTAVVSGVISPTNARTSSMGVIYSTDSNFGTYSTSSTQSNVVAGTYAFSLSGLTASTTYYAKSFIENKAGRSYGDVVSFSTSAPPVTLGSQLQGGTVAYIYQSGDPGYIAGETHGIIMSNSFLNNSQTTRWTTESTPTATGATGTALGTGITNSNTIYNLIGTSATAVNLCKNYSVTIGGTTYTNWFLPSVEELRKIHQAAPSYIYDLPSKYQRGVSDVAWFYYDTIYDRAVYIYTSSEVNSQMVNIWKHTTENFPVWKTDNFLVRAIRYF
jgi:hypothetical protein